MKGFNLIELLIIIALSSILGLMAIPSFQTKLVRQEATLAFDTLQQNIQLAKTEAIVSKKRTTVNHQIKLRHGFLSFNGELEDYKLYIQADGITTSAGTFIYIPHNEKIHISKTLVISTAGRPRIAN